MKTFIKTLIKIFLIVFVLLVGINFIGQYTHKNTPDEKEEPTIHYVEVRGKKGEVSLFVGMHKDSAKVLLGKPDEVRLNTIGRSTYEHWGYKIKKSYIADLNVDFENGKLTGVTQD